MHLELYYQWKCIKHLFHSDSFPTLEHMFSSDLPISLLNRLKKKPTHFLSRPQRANPELDKTLALHEIFV